MRYVFSLIVLIGVAFFLHGSNYYNILTGWIGTGLIIGGGLGKILNYIFIKVHNKSIEKRRTGA